MISPSKIPSSNIVFIYLLLLIIQCSFHVLFCHYFTSHQYSFQVKYNVAYVLFTQKRYTFWNILLFFEFSTTFNTVLLGAQLLYPFQQIQLKVNPTIYQRKSNPLLDKDNSHNNHSGRHNHWRVFQSLVQRMSNPLYLLTVLEDLQKMSIADSVSFSRKTHLDNRTLPDKYLYPLHYQVYFLVLSLHFFI